MNILKSFELFWRLPERIFFRKNIKVVHVETENSVADNLVQSQTSDDNIFLTVYNNRQVYNLLSSVLYKKKLLNGNKERKISNQCSFS